MDVRFNGIHQWRIAETKNASEMLLGDCSADLPGRRSDDGGWLSCEGVCAVRPTRPVDGILQRSPNRAGVLGCHDQHCIRRDDGVLEVGCNRGKLRVVVVAVEW